MDGERGTVYTRRATVGVPDYEQIQDRVTAWLTAGVGGLAGS
jgi:hypothetical protein